MIDRDLAVRLVVAAHARVNDHQEELSRLDSVAGDGDHGVNMATALAEAARRAEQDDHGTAAGVIRATGSAFHETVGGAAGALFGAFFGAVAGQLSKAAAPDATQLVVGMEKGLARVVRVGKAEPGHKTMIDALAPAVSDARESLDRENGLEAVMAAAARAARRGATATAGTALGGAGPLRPGPQLGNGGSRRQYSRPDSRVLGKGLSRTVVLCVLGHLRSLDGPGTGFVSSSGWWAHVQPVSNYHLHIECSRRSDRARRVGEIQRPFVWGRP